MKKSLALLLGFILVLSACSKQEEKKNTQNTVPKMIDVTIQTPETINPNEKVDIKTVVTQGDEKVADADEVKFEIWRSGQDDHETIEAKNEGKGVYSTTKVFEENGTYFIVAHVTARNMHNMPKKEMTVGEPDAANEHEHHDEAASEHHHSELSIQFNKDAVRSANKEETLATTIKHEESPLSEASVQFEIWKNNQKNHEFLEAKEKDNGTYQAVYTFPSSGIWNVKVHVEKDDIHDHLENSVEVK